MIDGFKRGKVVVSKAGHDKGELLAVLSSDEKFIYVADGKQRKVAQPKPKNPKHTECTEMIIEDENLLYDGRLRKSLNRLNEKLINGR